MVVRHAAAVSLMLLALSGCAAPKDTHTYVKLADDVQVQLLEAEVTANLGGISGVLVSEAVYPLAWVEVLLNGANRSTRTDADGLFAFDEVEPGLYTLWTGAFRDEEGRGYLAGQTTAEVRPGETARVRLLAPMDAARGPYQSPTTKYDGFLPLANGFTDYYAGWASQLVPESCQCVFEVEVDDFVETFVIEVYYESTTPTLASRWGADIRTEHSQDFEYCPGTTSPCLLHVGGGDQSRDARAYSIAIQSGDTEVRVNQAFDLFVTMFHGDPAPAGWSFTQSQG